MLSIYSQHSSEHGTYVAGSKTAETSVAETSVTLLVQEILKVLRSDMTRTDRVRTKPSFWVAVSYVFLMSRLRTALSRERPMSHSIER